MERKHSTAGLAAAIAMLILILDGKTALDGAASGIGLCIQTVIPALFPFFFLTPVLIGNLCPKILKPVAMWMGLPSGMEGLLIPAFLGGYPTGAQAVGRAWQEGTLSREEAERTLHFCSNAGPSFLFGMIGPQFSSPLAPWALWGIHILAAILVSRTVPGVRNSRCVSISLPKISFRQAISQAVATTGLVCGWVVLFRILISFLDRWVLWIFPAEIRVILCGLLELSNGCCMLSEIQNPELRFLVCTILLSFGGFCVVMQTAGVIAGLSTGPYLRGKLMQSVYALSLTVLMLPNFPGAAKWMLLIPAMVLFFSAGRNLRKNNSSIPKATVV